MSDIQNYTEDGRIAKINLPQLFLNIHCITCIFSHVVLYNLKKQ